MIRHGLDNGGGFEANGNLEPGEVDATTFCSRYVSDDQNIRIVRDINNSSNNPAPLNSQPWIKRSLSLQMMGYMVMTKSDGSESGTVMVKDSFLATFHSPEMITVVDTAIFLFSMMGSRI